MQNQVILSLGSNKGEKSLQINAAIAQIHLQIGTVIEVSSLYQSDSWGFESDDFLNCVILIHTEKTPLKILSSIKKIEKDFGRIKKQNNQYESRAIDIDIISFNDEIKNLEQLEIPHPQLQNRLFVLMPLNDLKLKYIHPILKKIAAICCKIVLIKPIANSFKTWKNHC